jgi:O-antigen/teichoic acid export membrane protein
MPVTLAIHPLVMNRWNEGNAKSALAALRAGVKYQVLLFLPIALGFGLFAPSITRFVLGKATPRAASIVLPLAASGFLWQLCLLAHKPLEILCLTRRMLAGMLVALAVNVGGNWLLIPRFGYQAAAYLSVASSATYLLLLLVLTPLRELRRAAAGPLVFATLNPNSAPDGCLTGSL